MSERANSNSHGTLSPVELWKQWNDTTAKLWSNVLGNGKETYVDPYGLYRSWLKNVGDAQKQMQSSTFGMMDMTEIWTLWFQATTEAMKKATEGGADPLGLMTQWLGMLEQARSTLQVPGMMPLDPFTFFKQWYDSTSVEWAKAVDDVIGTEKFIEISSQFLEAYASFTKASRLASEDYFNQFQIPTRSDIARVAELVVGLEEKVDQIEDAFENFIDGHAQVATNEAVGALESRLDRVESKLDKVLSALEKLEAREAPKPVTPTSAAPRKTTRNNAREEAAARTKTKS